MPTSSLSETLQNLIKNISEQNYDETLAQYRFWLDLGTVHGHIPQLQVNNDASLITSLDRSVNEGARLIHPTLDLFFRFVGDMENKIIPPCASDYHKKCCTEAVARCFEQNLSLVKPGVGWQRGPFFVAMNLIARWANLGFVEETVIRNHILQSLTSHPNLHDHQAGALMILFKLAGATFKAYVEPSVFDRSFQLLQGHYRHASASSEKRKLMEVRVPCLAKMDFWLRWTYRNWLVYGRVGGRTSLRHLCSRPTSQNRLGWVERAPLQLQPSYPWDFRRETSSLRFFSRPNLTPLLPQSRISFTHLLPPTLLLSAFQLYPTSRWRTLLMTIPLPIPRA